jgi:hypothetical protein
MLTNIGFASSAFWRFLLRAIECDLMKTKLHQFKIDIYVDNLIPGTSGEDVLVHLYNMINKVLGHMWDIENDTFGFIKSV